MKSILQFFVVIKHTSCHGRYCLCTRFFDPTHRHAEMLCLDHNHNALRVQIVHKRIGDLCRQLFLELQSSCKTSTVLAILLRPTTSPFGIYATCAFPKTEACDARTSNKM